MKTYQFRTTATMKEYNHEKWWIASDVVRDIQVQAETIRDALKEYQRTVQERDYISISDHAIKNPAPMYRDTKSGESVQVGYVITAKTDFDDNRRRRVTQYIDLWVTIHEIKNPFKEVTK